MSTSKLSPALVKRTGVAFNAAAFATKVPNYHSKGLFLYILLANVSGSFAATVKVQIPDPTDPTKLVDLPGAVTAALAANGLSILSIYPGNTVVANQTISQCVPSNASITVTPSGGAGAGDVTISAEQISA